MDLNLLLTRVMSDPGSLVQQVLQQAVDQLDRDGVLAAELDSPPAEQLAAALGNQLATLMAAKQASTTGWPAGGLDDRVDHYEELLYRNGVLAAALGACDCWGQHVDCPVCGGIGGPGWMRPDERLFASYVRPALRAVAKGNGQPSGTGQRRGEEHGGV